jgi:hypothetical protein
VTRSAIRTLLSLPGMNLRIAGVVKQDSARGCGTRVGGAAKTNVEVDVGGAVLDEKIKKLVEEKLARWPRLSSEREAEIRAMLTRYQDEMAASAFESLKEMRRREGLTKEMASRVWLI